MAGEFAQIYEDLADQTVVLDVFGAREDPVPGVTGALVADRFDDPTGRLSSPTGSRPPIEPPRSRARATSS